MIVELATSVCLSAAIVVLCSNFRRRTNRIYAALWLLFTAWNCTIIAASKGVELFNVSPNSPFFLWRRVNAAIFAFSPWVIWNLINSVSPHKVDGTVHIIKNIGWLSFGLCLAIISFHPTFIYLDPRVPYPLRGDLYFWCMSLQLCSYGIISHRILREIDGLQGLQRVEMILVALNVAIACISIIFATSLGNAFQHQSVRRAVFFILPASAVLSAWAMTSSRLYDLPQLLRIFAHRALVTVVLALGALGIWRHFRTGLADPVDALLLVGLWSGTAFWLDRRCREWLDLNGERALSEARRSVIKIGFAEAHPERLARNYEAFLAQNTGADFASILVDRGDAYTSNHLSLPKTRLGYQALFEAGWATPESLERRPSIAASDDLLGFLKQRSIGMITVSPRENREPALLVVVGQKKLGWPFTFPEVLRLQNLAELIDNILTHSWLAHHAAEKARVEHLALMSRGLAHDLKNLLTPVSTFLLRTDNHFPAGSTEAEVHLMARRSTNIMADYVREALLFSTHLAPNLETVDISALLFAAREVTCDRAKRKSTTVKVTHNSSRPLKADSVLLQRMLGNLLANAIDASEANRTISLSTADKDPGMVRFVVTDEGCGIPPDDIAKIFDPYYTTKEFGDDVRGFGLGLTICQKIVHLHGGRIAVDSQLERGTTITVDIPSCPITAF